MRRDEEVSKGGGVRTKGVAPSISKLVSKYVLTLSRLMTVGDWSGNIPAKELTQVRN